MEKRSHSLRYLPQTPNEKRKDDDTLTTTAESIDDQSTCRPVVHESNNILTIRINGATFTGIKSAADSLQFCEMDSGNEIDTGAEETLKERNRRLLRNERESMSQRKVRTKKRRGKYVHCSNVSQTIEEKDTASIEVTCEEKICGRAENFPKQREIMRIDRRWEFELLS